MNIPENTPPSQPDPSTTTGRVISPGNDLLTNCVACAHRVSRTAHSCPSCGHILNEKHISTSGFTWFGIIIVILSVFGFLSSMTLNSDGVAIFSISGIVSGMMFIGLGGIITLLRRL